MIAQFCPREDELVDALGRGFVGPELEAHVAGCESCKELWLVASAVLDDRAHAIAQAPVPSGGVMLLRMKMREQHEAEARARRSLFIGQGLTLGIAFVIIAAFLGGPLADAALHLATSLRVSLWLLVTIASALVIAPVAGWVAVRR